MKPTITFITVITICFTVLSCKENKEATDASPQAKTYVQLEKAEWFLGQWVNKSFDAEFSETWMKENDSVYTGESYFIKYSNDTLFAETMKLAETNGKLNMIVTVANQNDAQPVSFEMTLANDTLLIFENPEHDFPNKIAYRRVNNDSIVAQIVGIKDGKEASEQFPFKRR